MNGTPSNTALLFGCLVAGAAGCATAPPPITKIVNGRIVLTRAVGPEAYEHVARAQLYEEEERWQEAADELQRALPFDPDAAEVRALDRLRVVAAERQRGGLAQRRDRPRAPRLVRLRLGEVGLGEVPLHARPGLQRARHLLGRVVEPPQPDEQLRELRPHLRGVGIEGERALQLVGRLLPALLLLVELRPRHVLVSLGADRSREDDAPVHDLRDRRRRRRAPRRPRHEDAKHERCLRGCSVHVDT